MGKKNQEPERRPGYEPAKGFADPDVTPGAGPRDGRVTHYVNGGGNGTICNRRPVPTLAADYDNEDPSCPECANWLAAARRNTAARHPWSAPTSPAPAPAKPETK